MVQWVTTQKTFGIGTRPCVVKDSRGQDWSAGILQDGDGGSEVYGRMAETWRWGRRKRRRRPAANENRTKKNPAQPRREPRTFGNLGETNVKISKKLVDGVTATAEESAREKMERVAWHVPG